MLENFEITLKKVLACSNGENVADNLIWNEEHRYLAYTVFNVIVIESMNQEKSQKLLKEGNDQIYKLKMSPDKKYLLSYTKTGPTDGFPCVNLFDSKTFKKLN